MTTLNLNYKVEGTGEATIVWIHGFGGDLHIWDLTIPAFPNHRHFRFDYLGHGKSSKNISPQDAVPKTIELVAEIIRKTVDGPIIWVGHSFAGNLLCTLMNRFTKTKAAIFLDCSCLVTRETRDSRRQIAEQWLATSDYKATLSGFYDSLLGPKADKAKRSRIKASLAACDPEFLFQFYKTYDAIPERPKNEPPALILEAEHFSAKQDARSFIQYFPNAQRELIPDAHHFFFYEQADKFNEMILRFLQKID